MALDPHFEAKATFAAHWEDVIITRSNPTFDDVAPNHDHVVRIWQPSKTATPKTSGKTKSVKRPKLAIPVILHVS